MFVDSHCHLEGRRFTSDREQVLERARQAGVEALVAIGNGNGPAEADCGLRLAEQYDPHPYQQGRPRIFATLGVHPHEARLATDSDFAQLSAWAANPRVIAWGEIGLDYYYDHSPRDVQQAVFVRQMELAIETKLPIVIHCRPAEGKQDAWEDCLRLIGEHFRPSGLGGIMHCFTGELEQARASLEMGFLISFAGNVTFPKALSIRQAAAEVPLERMLIETDSPYLAPVPHRGKRNEPAFVSETARHVAELRGTTIDEIARATTENFYRFFRLSQGSGGQAQSRP